ncbi:hypothetical protein HJC23_012740 [Cyclotella cryptica]|uniref:RNA-editing substrate-binding complex 6 protein domain-containing protein n=1 Tax=Cyclotella cryptica TaxID=29204 RepID=A0ABD3P7U6_9STRA|eukprot:CCRYP_016776-RA/>CCRYP_016776-RA protein AED:0.29 eAED:0.29 QI:0/-1/0/1/-1/1/1/0/518
MFFFTSAKRVSGLQISWQGPLKSTFALPSQPYRSSSAALTTAQRALAARTSGDQTLTRHSNNINSKLLLTGYNCISQRCTSTSFHSSPKIAARSRKWFYKQQTFLNTKDCSSVEQVVQLTMENIKKLAPGNYCAIWVRISELLQKEHRVVHDTTFVENQKLEQELKRILYKTIRSADMFSPKHLSGIILALAKIVRHGRRVGRIDSGMRDNESSTLLHPLYRILLGDNSINQDDNMLLPLFEAANNRLQKFEPRYLSNLSYACALLRANPTYDSGITLFDNIASEAIKQIDKYNGQDVSNMVWAFATLSIQHSELFKAVGDTVVHTNLKRFQPQDFSNIVWSFATLHEDHPLMFQSVGDEIAALDLRGFKPQELSNTVWSFATVNADHPAMFQKVGDTIVGNYVDLKKFTPQNISNIVWAFATAHEQHLHLFKKVGVTIAEHDDLKAFSPQALSNIVSAFSSAGVVHLKMFDKIGNTIAEYEDLKSFKPQEISSVVRAFETVNVDHPGMLQRINAHGT